MRWPWSEPEPVEDDADTAAEEIAELMVEHQVTLERAGKVLSDRSARIMEHYENANRERRA